MSVCSGGGGGLQLQLGAMPFRGFVCMPAPWFGGGGVPQGWQRQCCPTVARRGRSTLTWSSPWAHSPWRTSFRRAATYRGAKGGIGEATISL